LDFVYDVNSFLRDLTFIQNKTFITGLVCRAFKEFGMVLPNAEQVKTNMRKYYKQSVEIKALIDDLGNQLLSITKIDESLKRIVFKAGLGGPLSSPTRSLLKTTASNAFQALYQGEIFRVHANNLTKRFQEIMTRKPHTRKRVQSGGRLRVEDA
jgi:hypothetical protein